MSTMSTIPPASAPAGPVQAPTAPAQTSAAPAQTSAAPAPGPASPAADPAAPAAGSRPLATGVVPRTPPPAYRREPQSPPHRLPRPPVSMRPAWLAAALCVQAPGPGTMAIPPPPAAPAHSLLRAMAQPFGIVSGPGRPPTASEQSSPPVAVIHARRTDLHCGSGRTWHAVVAAATVDTGDGTTTRLFIQEGHEPGSCCAQAVILDAFAHLYRRAATYRDRPSSTAAGRAYTGPVLVHITDSVVRREIASVASSFPAIELADAPCRRTAAAAPVASRAIGKRIRRIDDEFRSDIADAALRRQAAPPLRVATDASKRLHGPAVASAYVTEEGDYRQEAPDGADTVLEAELFAINMAITHLRDRSLRILTDSMNSIRALSGPPERASASYGPAVAAIVRRVHRAADGRSIRFTWVRGHSGHPLNDIADRLALTARRGFEAGLSPDEVDAIARNILEDLPAPGAATARLAG